MGSHVYGRVFNVNSQARHDAHEFINSQRYIIINELYKKNYYATLKINRDNEFKILSKSYKIVRDRRSLTKARLQMWERNKKVKYTFTWRYIFGVNQSCMYMSMIKLYVSYSFKEREANFTYADKYREKMTIRTAAWIYDRVMLYR